MAIQNKEWFSVKIPVGGRFYTKDNSPVVTADEIATAVTGDELEPTFTSLSEKLASIETAIEGKGTISRVKKNGEYITPHDGVVDLGSTVSYLIINGENQYPSDNGAVDLGKISYFEVTNYGTSLEPGTSNQKIATIGDTDITVSVPAHKLNNGKPTSSTLNHGDTFVVVTGAQTTSSTSASETLVRHEYTIGGLSANDIDFSPVTLENGEQIKLTLVDGLKLGLEYIPRNVSLYSTISVNPQDITLNDSVHSKSISIYGDNLSGITIKSSNGTSYESYYSINQTNLVHENDVIAGTIEIQTTYQAFDIIPEGKEYTDTILIEGQPVPNAGWTGSLQRTVALTIQGKNKGEDPVVPAGYYAKITDYNSNFLNVSTFSKNAMNDPGNHVIVPEDNKYVVILTKNNVQPNVHYTTGGQQATMNPLPGSMLSESKATMYINGTLYYVYVTATMMSSTWQNTYIELN